MDRLYRCDLASKWCCDISDMLIGERGERGEHTATGSYHLFEPQSVSKTTLRLSSSKTVNHQQSTAFPFFCMYGPHRITDVLIFVINGDEGVCALKNKER